MGKYIELGIRLYGDNGEKYTIYGCLRCGNLVFDREIHDQYHKDLDYTKARAVSS